MKKTFVGCGIMAVIVAVVVLLMGNCLGGWFVD
jgi:hypothetical protein